jgi:DNA-directed RNA polymerase subunit omega
MDIISLPVNFDHDRIDSKFRLVAIASQRAKELSLGAKPKIESKSKKITSIAVEEACMHNLEFVTGDEARIAREEAGKFDYRKLLEESRKAATGGELSELEKDLKVYLDEKESTDKKSFDELFAEKGEDNFKE